MHYRFRLLLTGFFLLSTLNSFADILYLQGGRKVQGTFLGGDSRTVQFLQEDGQVESFAISDVDTLVFANQANDTRTPLAGPSPDYYPIPQGTNLVVRMIDSINSDVHKAGNTFRATLEEPVTLSGDIRAPKGSHVLVQLARVKQSGKLMGQEEIALQLRSITVGDNAYSLTHQFAHIASEGKGKQTAKVVGGATIFGALIGAITGGKKGAAVGAAAGASAGTAVQLVRGQKVQVSSEALVTFSFDESLTLEDEWQRLEEAEEHEHQVEEGRAFGEHQEEAIRDWFSNKKNLRNLPPGLAKKDHLPPGLERQLRTNGTLPPGLQKRLQPLPRSLVRLLPRIPYEVVRGVIGPHVVLLELESNEILDILWDVYSKKG